METKEAVEKVESTFDCHENDRACNEKERENIQKEKNEIIELLQQGKENKQILDELIFKYGNCYIFPYMVGKPQILKSIINIIKNEKEENSDGRVKG